MRLYLGAHDTTRRVITTCEQRSNLSRARSKRLQQQGRISRKEEKLREQFELEKKLQDPNETHTAILDTEEEIQSGAIKDSRSSSQQEPRSSSSAPNAAVYEPEVLTLKPEEGGPSSEDAYSQLEPERIEIRRKAQVLLTIIQSGDQLEEAIEQHRDEIDNMMLDLLARRIEAAKQYEQLPEAVESLNLLYRRLKLEADRNQASPSLRLLDEILEILEVGTAAQMENSVIQEGEVHAAALAANKEESRKKAMARMRVAFGDQGVPVSNILSLASQIATEGGKAADVLLGEGIEIEDFITDITNFLDMAMAQQQQLEQYVEQVPESDSNKQALGQAVQERRQAMAHVEEVLGMAHRINVETTSKVLKGG